MSSVSALERRARTSRNDFIGRFWTAGELNECQGNYARLAVRWSAKEATMKALGAGIGRIDPIDIEVVITVGSPELRLHDSAQLHARQLGLTAWTLSMSHESDLAIAVVVAFGEERP